MKIFIQIPCYNEEDQIKQVIEDIRQSVDSKKYDYKIIIIDDGSTDKTVKIAKDNNVDKIISIKRNTGVGYAFNQGRDYAYKENADILINTDADNQYKSKYIADLIEKMIDTKSDIIVGVRKFDEIPHFSKLKKILQKIGSRVVRIISGQKITDAASGFRAYSKDAIKKLQVNSHYTYTLETLIQAKEKNLLINETPIEINPPNRQSRLFKSIPEYVSKQILIILKAFMLYKPLQFFSTLSVLPILIGGIAILRFIYFYSMGDGSGHIQSLILGSSLLLLGVLLFAVGLLAYIIRDAKHIIEKKIYWLFLYIDTLSFHF